MLKFSRKEFHSCLQLLKEALCLNPKLPATIRLGKLIFYDIFIKKVLDIASTIKTK